jgi:hypothetical protein
MGEQSARSPELGSIKVKNSTRSSRNIFIINEQVVVITIYNKLVQYWGKIEYVFCCFPNQLSQVIVQYLIYVLLFSYIIAKTKGDFLFVNKQGPWIEDQLSKEIVKATAKHIGV